jgi:D-arabinose 1-dehydrogenase-like Zn-dependent alcohol dehydrogenase
MKAAVLREFNKPATIEKNELAPPKEKEILVKTRYTGFCHSDLHFMQGSFRNFPLPLVIGHQVSDKVEEVGTGVNSFRKGDQAETSTSKDKPSRKRGLKWKNQFRLEIEVPCWAAPQITRCQSGFP